jgi:hypothetical protein
VHLALHHLARRLHRLRVVLGALEEVKGVAHRRERVAQLVREHRQELVLLPVGVGERVHALAQLVLEALPLGDVAHDAGEVAPRADVELAHREIHGEDAAVLAPSHHLAPDADDFRLAGGEIVGEIGVVLAIVGLGHQDLDVAPEHLGAPVAEQFLRGRVERLDVAALVDGDDAVDDVVDHRAHALFGEAQLFLGAPSLGDVAHDAGEVAAAFQPELADGELHGKGAAVLAPAEHLAAAADDLRLAGAQVAADVAVVLVAVGLRHQHAHVLPDHLAGRVAEDALGGAVEGRHRAALVDGDDRVDDVIHHRAHAFCSLEILLAAAGLLHRRAEGIPRRRARLAPAARPARRRAPAC